MKEMKAALQIYMEFSPKEFYLISEKVKSLSIEEYVKNLILRDINDKTVWPQLKDVEPVPSGSDDYPILMCHGRTFSELSDKQHKFIKDVKANLKKMGKSDDEIKTYLATKESEDYQQDFTNWAQEKNVESFSSKKTAVKLPSGKVAYV